MNYIFSPSNYPQLTHLVKGQILELALVKPVPIENQLDIYIRRTSEPASDLYQITFPAVLQFTSTYSHLAQTDIIQEISFVTESTQKSETLTHCTIQGLEGLLEIIYNTATLVAQGSVTSSLT